MTGYNIAMAILGHLLQKKLIFNAQMAFITGHPNQELLNIRSLVNPPSLLQSYNHNYEVGALISKS